MKKINQFKTFVIVAIIATILGIITLTMTMDTNHMIVRVLNDGISTVQNAFVNVAHDIRNFGQSTFDLFETHEENQRLRAEMYAVEIVNIELELWREEALLLREMVGIDETLIDFERISAVTIGRDINSWHDFITVNRGTVHGVELGMAVVSPEGFVIGRVTDASLVYSRFHLLKPHNSDIRAHVQVLGVRGSEGTLDGYDAETGELVVRQVRRDVEVEVGDKVITSGLGGVFPRGLLAGYVTRYEIDGLTQTLFLENHVEYDDLRFVFIIKRAMTDADDLTLPDETIETEETTEIEETTGTES